MNWYYVHAGQQIGPVDEAALESLLASGTITADTLVWKEGMANWLPYAEVRSPASGLITAAPPVVTQPMGGPAVAAVAAGKAVCAECGRLFPTEDTISYGNVRVCAGCKPIFVQKLSEGMEVAAGPLRYAGFWIRFAAVFVDGLIMKAVSVLMCLVAGFGLVGSFTGTPASSSSDFSVLPFVLMGLQIIIALGYEAFFIGKYGATLGKMACKIQVVVSDGSKVTYGRSIGRYFAKIISYVACLIGYIMAGFDDEKRALHDRICNTRVIFK
ncbi:MAG: domain containing protein [Pedosphaera sp.]|nr:domain containing protein [Pedosphaera sp.]